MGAEPQLRSGILATDKVLGQQLHADICTLKPSLDLRSDYFAVFGIKPAFIIDQQQLATTYRTLQQMVHPDRFTRECDRTQRLAQQQAAHVNEAYNTLKSPLARAQYLLELAGQHRAGETTLRDPAFLLAQMALRERLEASQHDLPSLDQLLASVRDDEARYQEAFAEAWQREDWCLARMLVDKMQFAAKLVQEIDLCQARLLDD